MNEESNFEEIKKKLAILFNDLECMHEHLYEIIDRIKSNLDDTENLMKLHTIDFNNAIYDIDICYKEILDICVELYWNNPSYICTPTYKGIEWK